MPIRHSKSKWANKPNRGIQRQFPGLRLSQRCQHQHARLFPVAFDRPFRNAERFGDLPLGQPGEVAHFDDLHQTRVDLAQVLQGVVNAHDIRVIAADRFGDVSVERQRRLASAAPLCEPGTGEVDDDRAHHSRRISEKMGSVRDSDLPRVGKPQIGLVHQRSGIQERERLMRTELRAGQPAQFVVEHREGGVGRGGVAFTGRGEQVCEFGHERLLPQRSGLCIDVGALLTLRFPRACAIPQVAWVAPGLGVAAPIRDCSGPQFVLRSKTSPPLAPPAGPPLETLG